MGTKNDSTGNFIDTANSYQGGQSEEWIGDWMKKRGNRDQIGKPGFKLHGLQ